MKLLFTCLLIAVLFPQTAGPVFSAAAPVYLSPEEVRRILATPAPNAHTVPKAELVKIYMERARAAATIGDVQRQLRELNEGDRDRRSSGPSVVPTLRLSGTDTPGSRRLESRENHA